MLSSIGPVTVASELLAPGSFTPSGPPNAFGGIPTQFEFVIESLTEAKQIRELIHNFERRQRLDDALGVLEWIECTDNLTDHKGWYLLDEATFKMDRINMVSPASDNFVVCSVHGHFFGAKNAVINGTFASRANGLSLTPLPTFIGVFPLRDVQVMQGVQSSQYITEFGEPPNALAAYCSTAYTAVKGNAWWRTLGLTITQHRPYILDVAGNRHYGPYAPPDGTATGVGIGTGLFRCTKSSGGFLLQVVDPANANVWTSLGTVVVHSDTTLNWIVGFRLYDDKIEMDVSIESELFTFVIHVGEYGMRVIPRTRTSSFAIDLPAVLGSDGNGVYRETSAGPGGGRRFIGVSHGPGSTDLANGIVNIAGTRQGFVGWEPASPGALTSASLQVRRFLVDRYERLTIE